MAGADGVIAEFNSWDHKFDAGDEVFFIGRHVVDAMNGRRTTLRVEKVRPVVEKARQRPLRNPSDFQEK